MENIDKHCLLYEDVVEGRKWEVYANRVTISIDEWITTISRYAMMSVSYQYYRSVKSGCFRIELLNGLQFDIKLDEKNKEQVLKLKEIVDKILP